MKSIPFYLFGIGLCAALACTKYGMPTKPTPLPEALGADYVQFRCSLGAETWWATDSVSIQAVADWSGQIGDVYGFECCSNPPVTWHDVSEASTWVGSELPVTLLLEGFAVQSQFSSQWVVSNIYPVTLGAYSMPPGTSWTLSKTLNDETEESAECCFRTFFLSPQLGSGSPIWYFVRKGGVE